MVNKTSVAHDESSTQNVATEFKAPEFMEEDIKLWFAVLERKFDQLEITTQKQRFDLTMNALPMTVLKKVRDAIIKPPADEYDHLKTRLLQELEISLGAKVLQLLTKRELGDKKPSALLREMRQLAKGHISDKVLMSIFLGRLPVYVQVILIGCTDQNPEQTAMMADRIIEYRNQPSFNSVKSPPDSSVSTMKLNQLEEKIAKMHEQLDKLEQKILKVKEIVEQSVDSKNNCGNSSTTSLNSTSAPFNQDSLDTICYYHKKYGVESRTCQRPCSFGRSPNVNSVQYADKKKP